MHKRSAVSTLAGQWRLAGLLAAAALACSNVTVIVGGGPTAAPATDAPPAAAAPTEPPLPTEQPPTEVPPTEALPTPEEVAVTPSPTPLFFGELEILPGRSFVDAADQFVVVGEVVNHTANWYRFAVVEVSYFDASGNHIGAKDSFVSPDALPPGERGVFAVYYRADERPAPVAAFTYLLESADVTDDRPYTGLEIAEVEESTEDRATFVRYIFSGVVRNTGDQDCDSTSVRVALYDAAGRLLDTVVTFPEPESLAAGEAGTWEMGSNELEAPYADFRLWAECFTL